MSLIPRVLQSLQNEAVLLGPSLRAFCTKPPKAPETKAAPKPKAAPQPKAAAPPPPKPAAPAAPVYTSAATPSPPAEPIGPGASKSGDYPNTEYYSYNKMSYFDLEVEMGTDRIPQPDSNNGRF